MWTHWGPGDDDWAEGALTHAGSALRSAVHNLTLGRTPLPRDPVQQQILESEASSTLNSLKTLRWIERSIEVEYAFLVSQARTEGASWSEIGRALNITKQAAQQRFGEICSVIIPFCTYNHDWSGEDLVDAIDAYYRSRLNIWEDIDEP